MQKRNFTKKEIGKQKSMRESMFIHLQPVLRYDAGRAMREQGHVPLEWELLGRGGGGRVKIVKVRKHHCVIVVNSERYLL